MNSKQSDVSKRRQISDIRNILMNPECCDTLIVITAKGNEIGVRSLGIDSSSHKVNCEELVNGCQVSIQWV